MKHIMVMSGTGAIGLMALFLVDLLDMFFISLLGEVELAAAIGFAGTLIFFSTSVSIGTSIAMGALVSRALGANEAEKARQLTVNVMIFAVIICAILVSLMLWQLPQLLAMIGATGNVAAAATDYLVILLPSAPFIAISMSAGAALRGIGDARRSMIATLIGGGVNAVLDPLFIFGLSMGMEGAAIASVFARLAVMIYSLHAVIVHHNLIARPQLGAFFRSLATISAIAFPAILTNTATPIGNAIVTSQIAQFGESYVAGYAVIGRIMPVTFALVFSLSGAIGPIIGQNFGAGRWDRISRSLSDALIFVSLYCVLVSAILWFLQDHLIALFSLQGDAATLLSVFCSYVAITFIFNGALFVSNAAFNNLNRPTWSTALNMGKATLGTIPFVWLGGLWGGASGVLIGQAIGGMVFGCLGVWLVRRQVLCMARAHERREQQDVLEPSVPLTPFCSSRTYMGQEDAVDEPFVEPKQSHS
ncbi:MATE family efflux transporter [Photobacterium aphoticum]|uniref:Multidrug resistance protein NorM n=3 Tax=Photobacterium aphoticum TaxID=754436 RepID=A0A0J1JLK3_9GAMM|nr:MATE family efflux transporter [Photobacterium aphoticum]KLV03012.1 multidrug transporter MatE [Photobacterium aphoticum]PSU57870.1 MATE family efflux transporter [Photobacterium aphoticum]GHA60479.1 MATE family efflux transporter [Photobacterium aphoticum]